MASASFTLSNQFIGTAVSAVAPSSSPPTCMRFRQQSLRVSASYATAERPSTSHIASQTSLYEVLGIQMGATCKEIKAAYRRLARVVHPDVASNNASAAADEFIEIHKAYATLSDPEKRTEYDRTLFRQRQPLNYPSVLSAAPTYSAGYTRRTWETDQCW